MIGEEGYPVASGCFAAANDNGTAEARVEAAVLVIARLIGRRIAREEYERHHAANDNAPVGDAGER